MIRKPPAPDTDAVRIGGAAIAAGERATIEIPVADLYTHTSLTMPVHVVNGRHAGPTLFVSAAVQATRSTGWRSFGGC